MSKIVWEIADLVELIPGNYYLDSKRSWIYGIGYIEDIQLNDKDKKIYKIVIFNAIKQQARNLVEIEIGEYTIYALEIELETWFKKMEI